MRKFATKHEANSRKCKQGFSTKHKLITESFRYETELNVLHIYFLSDTKCYHLFFFWNRFPVVLYI